MVLSIFGYSNSSGTGIGNADYYDYNNYRFVLTEQGWLTYIKNNPVIFYFGPRELENFKADIDLRTRNLDFLDKIYISFNPNENLQASVQEFIKFIRFQSNLIVACSVDIPGCDNIPVKTCKDADDKVGVVEFELSEKTEITTKDTCISVKGTQTSIAMLADKIALTELGVIE